MVVVDWTTVIEHRNDGGAAALIVEASDSSTTFARMRSIADMTLNFWMGPEMQTLQPVYK